MSWISTGITSPHELAEFDCGKAKLNEWLCESALESERKWTTRTYVWVKEGDLSVKAYYAIAPTQVDVEKDGLQRRFAAGLRSVPAFLLAKFGLDQSIQGQGLGEQLLVDAVGKLVGAAQVSGGRVIVVDAIDEEAVSFYRKYNFVPVENTKDRLVMKMATARDAFGLPPT